MSQGLTALAGMAFLVATSMWLSLRAASASDLGVLPLSCRRRLNWWRANARSVYVICAAVALGSMAMHIRWLAP